MDWRCGRSACLPTCLGRRDMDGCLPATPACHTAGATHTCPCLPAPGTTCTHWFTLVAANTTLPAYIHWVDTCTTHLPATAHLPACNTLDYHYLLPRLNALPAGFTTTTLHCGALPCLGERTPQAVVPLHTTGVQHSTCRGRVTTGYHYHTTAVAHTCHLRHHRTTLPLHLPHLPARLLTQHLHLRMIWVASAFCRWQEPGRNNTCLLGKAPKRTRAAYLIRRTCHLVCRPAHAVHFSLPGLGGGVAQGRNHLGFLAALPPQNRVLYRHMARRHPPPAWRRPAWSPPNRLHTTAKASGRRYRLPAHTAPGYLG